MQPTDYATEFVRLPKRDGRCPITGLSRSAVEQIIVPSKFNNFNPPVKAHVRRSKPGNARGVWLIPKKAYLDYINGLPTSL